MRLIIQIILIGAILISCNVNSEQSENIGIKQKTLSDSNVYKNDTLKELIKHAGDLSGYLKSIRQKVKRTNSIKEWSSIDKRKIETDSTRGGGEYYFLYGDLKLIRQYQFDQSSRRTTEFYIENDTIFFVLEKLNNSSVMKKAPKSFELSIDSIFFEANRIIKIIANEDSEYQFIEEYLIQKQIRLDNQYRNLINALN